MEGGKGREEENEERKGTEERKGGRVGVNVLGHMLFTNQSNKSFSLCVWDQLYLHPLQRVTEVIKCLQQEHMMSHTMDIHIPPRQNTRCLTPWTYISPQASSVFCRMGVVTL